MERELNQLEQVLREQLAAHEHMSALLDQKLAALRRADHAQVARLAQEENAQVQRLAELEKQRLNLVAGLTLAVEPGAPEPMRMAQLAERLQEPVRGKLLVLRAELRKRMEEVQKRAAVARRAAETLVLHMQGLMQSITGALAGVSTYGRAGTVPVASAAVSTFSTTV